MCIKEVYLRPSNGSCNCGCFDRNRVEPDWRKYAVTLGFIAGVADIVPYFGPIIGALPAVCLALLQSKN